MNITEISITLIKPREDGLVGFVSFVLNNWFYMGNIGIYNNAATQGFRLAYPTRITKGGNPIAIYHPINSEVEKSISKPIIEKVEKLIINNHGINTNRI